MFCKIISINKLDLFEATHFIIWSFKIKIDYIFEFAIIHINLLQWCADCVTKSRLYIGEVCRKKRLRLRQTFLALASLGHLGRRSTERIIHICFTLPKVAKASKKGDIKSRYRLRFPQQMSPIKINLNRKESTFEFCAF